MKQASHLQLPLCNQGLSLWLSQWLTFIFILLNYPPRCTSFRYYIGKEREGGEGGVCLQIFFPLSLASLPRLSAAFPCPHSAVSNRRGLQGEAGRIQTGMGLKEIYCEVTFFPNADRSQVSSRRNYPHESCPLWCLPRMRTWKGIRYGRTLSASHSAPGSHLLQAAWSARRIRAHVECPWMWNSSTAMCCYLRVCCSQVTAHFSIHTRPPVCALPSLPFTQRSLW